MRRAGVRAVVVEDERSEALKELVRLSGAIYDHCVSARSTNRQECDEADKRYALSLDLRAAQRLARALIAAADRVVA